MSIFYSSGDGGVRGNHDSLAQCTNNTFVPVFPATCPYVTSVGATVNIKPETAAKFSSGGFSNFFARPAYQNAAVPKFLATLPSDFPGIFNKAGRGFPDVRVSRFSRYPTGSQRSETVVVGLVPGRELPNI